MIRERIAALGNLLMASLLKDKAEELARAGARRAVAGVGQKIPSIVRRQIPDFRVLSGGRVFIFEGGHLYVGPEGGHTAAPPQHSPSSESTQPEGSTEDDGSPGFWSSLPRGVKTGVADIDGETTVSYSLPHNEGDIRALIQRLRDTIDNLDDVEAFDVVEAVDDDMYQLWKELERKMQSHRRSEAKHQLKDMFTI